MTRTTELFDVLVAGGGPAGAAAAICLARQGNRVALIESTGFDQPRYGETLPPEINPVLRDLALWDPFQALEPLEAPGILSVWGSPLPVEVDFVNNVHGPGWHIDRRRFDRMLLAEAVRAGAQVCSHRRVEMCSRDNEGWRICEYRSRFLVDAAGRNGLRIDGNADRETEDVLLAIALTTCSSNDAERDLRTCIEAVPSGWWYSAPLPGGTAIAMFFTDPAIYRNEGVSIAEQLRAAPLISRRLARGGIQDSRVLHVTSSRRRRLFGDAWSAVGDSAASYDPLSGRGLFKALRQADRAATAITAYLRGDTDALRSHAAVVRGEFDQYSRQRSLYYASEHRWPERPFWRARAERGRHLA